MRIIKAASFAPRALLDSALDGAFIRHCLAILVGLSGLLATISQVSAATTQDAPAWWQPEIGESWQWQLTGDLDLSFDVDVYDLDLVDTPEEVVEALHAEGRYVICYISVGTREDWRPDADDFPAEVLGDDYDEWPGETWLDIRRLDLLGPVLGARLDLCRDKGFDGIEPDNVDAFSNETGLDLTEADELAFIQWLADEAHARGLSIGLKNVPELAEALVDEVDWALTESCYAGDWCEEMAPIVEAGKPVFMAEYTDAISEEEFREDACAWADELGFSAILKNIDLDAERVGCPVVGSKNR